MNRTILTFSLLLLTVVAWAQGTVRGHVVEKQTNEGMEFANVRVLQGSKFIKGAISDSEGSFNIAGLAYGSYTLQVTSIGYKEVTRQFTLTQKNSRVTYATIYMTEDAQSIGEVEVRGQRSQMRLEVDRKVFTVDQVLSAAGGAVTDLLESIPSIEVTTDGEISLRGNSSVEVWINGKASGLTADNRYEILQQIPAESIERIEVIDNPSAKYSPEGSAGIINIVLKRDRMAGYYGSARIGMNTRGGWNTGVNINYTSGLFDAFANVGFRHRHGKSGGLSEQEYLNTNTYQNYISDNENKGENLFARMGLTWHMTLKDDLSLTGMTLQGNNDNYNVTPYHYGTIGAPQDTYQQYRLITGDRKPHMYNVELGYTHTFSDVHKLDMNVSFNRWKSDNNSYYQDSIWYMDGLTPTQYSYQYRPMFNNNRTWEAKLDYENQLNENTKIEAGYNGRFSHENSPQESWIDNNSWTGGNMVEDEAYYNRFIYDMNVHALYATLNFKLWKRLGVMAGLRGEYWKVFTESYNYNQEHNPALRDAPFKKDYFQLFPSLFLNYELSETAQLQLNYTRRLRRPWGGQLNSFKNTSDASMIQFGNPLLTPEYTNSFSLNFLKTWDKHTLSVSTYYRPTTDVIQRIRWQSVADGMMYMTSENVAKRQNMGIEVIGKNSLWRILDLTTTVNAYYSKLDDYSYVIENQTISGKGEEAFSWDARMLASLMLPYDLSIQLTGSYRSRGAITQGHRQPNAGLDIGVRKTFFNKALALAINWRDVFDSRHWENYTSSDTFWRHQKNWHKRGLNFQLTWNFGNMGTKKRPDGPEGQERSDDMTPTYDGGGGFE